MYEKLPDGGFVRHLQIVYYQPGKSLRLTGGLGPLQELGVHGSLVFSVDRGAGHSELRVFRGRVRLTVPGQPSVIVTAGHWAEAGAGPVIVHDFDVGGYQGWQDRWLSGDRIRLGDAIARLGRYSDRPIRLADPALANETFNGRFRLDRPVESLTLIGELFDMPLDRRGHVLRLGPKRRD